MSSLRARVLIVDDNPEDVAVYSRWLLASTEGTFRIFTATSVWSALAAYDDIAPDCVLLDFALGESTGLDFLAELTRRGSRPAVVAMTGNGSEAIAIEFMKNGAGDYLNKSRMTAGDLCAAVIVQISKHALRRKLAVYRARERVINKELTAALARAAFLLETGKRFAGPLGMDQALDAAASGALPFLGETCVIDLFENGALRRRAVSVDKDPPLSAARDRLFVREPSLARNTGVGKTIHDGLPVYISGDAFADAAGADPDIAALLDAGCVAVSFLPLRYAETLIGVLSLGTQRPGGSTTADRTLLNAYAQRVAAVIASAQVVDSERILGEEAQASAARLAFQSRVSTLFARSLNWENTLEGLVKLLTAAFCDSAIMFSVEQPTQQIALITAASKTAELSRTISQYYTEYPPRVDDLAGTGRAVRTARAQFSTREFLTASAKSPLTPRQDTLLTEWGAVATISLPLLVKGAVTAVLVLVRDRSKRYFDSSDAEVAEEIGRRTATYMENARQYERQFGIALALQRALLPTELPAVPELLFAVRYFAGADGMDVGGDWYDIVDVAPDRMVITIGDVVGRGINAAVAMGQYRDILRAYAFENFGPAAALTRLNDLVHALGGEAFATCTVLVLDRKARRIVYASAGHPPPLLRLPAGTVAVLDGARSMPIGAWPHTRYSEATMEMPIGATLFLYTDGLVETRRRSASDGVELLATALSRSSSDVELMIEDVLRDLAPGRSDDIAILAIEMLPLQNEALKRWTFSHIDRAAVQTIRDEFDAILERSADVGSDTFAARVILGELLSNVAQHAPGAFRLELAWSGDFPDLSLYDNGPGFPIPEHFTGPADPLSVSGRGLPLIAELSRGLTIVRRPAGGLATCAGLPVRNKHRRAAARSSS